MSQDVFKGLDVGYSNLKVCWGSLGGDAQTILLPAGAGPIDELDEQVSGGRVTGGEIVWARQQRWVAGIDPRRLAYSRRELHQGYTETHAYQALAMAGIAQSGNNTIRQLVTGLPVSIYKDREQRARLKSLLEGQHRVGKNRSVNVDNVYVTMQPLGAFVEASVGGADRDILNEGRVAVVDAGYYSFDWTLIEGGSVKQSSAGTDMGAMSQMVESINSLIRDAHQDSPGADAIEDALRNGKRRILLHGEWLALEPFLKTARAKVAGRAVSAMRRAYRDERPVDLFILTGGGGEQYENALLESYPQAKTYTSNDPAQANSVGFWHMAQQRAV